MTEPLLCENGCTRSDQTPLVASHGRYCARCWGRLDMPLSQATELAAHLISNVTAIGGEATDRVDSSRDAPVPFNQAAFDDASELYSMLTYWTTIWARHLEQPAPEITAGAWRNANGTVIGLPAGVTPERASTLVGNLARWIRNRLDAILATTRHDDDINAFTEQIGDVWRMNARWPRIERPSYAPTPCPIQGCAARVSVYPPTFPGDTRRIVCDKGHWFPEDEYDTHAEEYRAAQKDRMRTLKTAHRLAKKYGIGN